MPKIYITFVWHMHQPCYKDLVSNEYRLPWTRMHALKDYYGMVHILKDFPHVHQTFNLVPSLLAQIEEYAAGAAVDPFLRCALKPAEELTTDETSLILHYFFQANSTHLIGRYPRYAELYDAWKAADRNMRRAQHVFNPQTLRDLQVLSQLAWFDEEFLNNDREVVSLVSKGRNYSLDEQALMGRKQIEILQHVLPVYRQFASTGQIEISATPFYHPILPLLCDSNIAGESNPHVPLPSRFRYPQDARAQLERSIAYVEEKTGIRPAGLWPSEGSVSDEALTIAAETGFQWAATDNGVLSRTIQRPADSFATYRPYLWENNGHSMKMIFRDHYLSDLVGFVYSRMHATDAASDFLHRIRENCDPILRSGRDALVPVILDGENAWEHYHRNGRPFLTELYKQLDGNNGIEAVTVSEALKKVPAEPLKHIHPGSWINANFDVWIGFEEDNRSWELLKQAREAFAGVSPSAVSTADYKLAEEELFIAEGSDWCWWYGPHHDCENRQEFDQLFRDHLANMYHALHLTPPAELSRSILRARVTSQHRQPVERLTPTIDGEVSSYFEWLYAGTYRVEARSGSMHGRRFFVKELLYGTGASEDAELLHLRLDFLDSESASLPGMEVRVHIDGKAVRLVLAEKSVTVVETEIPGVEAAFKRVLEIAIPLGEKTRCRLDISLWLGGLPMDALPPEGTLEITTAVAAAY
ncbi:MAG: glycoside hydrolase [Acidobacteria bacterium]|nr:glycoside hydrolase [Acidobacteriota bacterium]